MNHSISETPFRVVDFLILMLKTQGEAMKRLSDLFSEDILAAAVERREDRIESLRESGKADPNAIPFRFVETWISDSCPSGGIGSEHYGELEATIRAAQFSERVEFYLWSYPHYRDYIESSIDLGARLVDPSSGAAFEPVPMIEDAVERGLEWLGSLEIAEPFATQVQKHVAPVWTAFRAEALRRLGRNPLRRV